MHSADVQRASVSICARLEVGLSAAQCQADELVWT